jgi:hypothetical protein
MGLLPSQSARTQRGAHPTPKILELAPVCTNSGALSGRAGAGVRLRPGWDDHLGEPAR